MRQYWRGDEAMLPELAARRIPADLFEGAVAAPGPTSTRSPRDGFTLRDVVSYNDKHNEPNGEANHDGHNANYSWNHGVEGDPDSAIRALREQKRSMMATLLLAQGTPMLLGGDEFGRTQTGNNNAYNQDNEINWFDWQGLTEEGPGPDRVRPVG